MVIRNLITTPCFIRFRLLKVKCAKKIDAARRASIKVIGLINLVADKCSVQ